MKYLRNEKALKLIGRRVRLIRLEQKISQRQLAFEAGISEMQIRRIEKGTLNTGISTLIAIAEALSIHPKELFDIDL